MHLADFFISLDSSIANETRSLRLNPGRCHAGSSILSSKYDCNCLRLMLFPGSGSHFAQEEQENSQLNYRRSRPFGHLEAQLNWWRLERRLYGN